jgi:3',5'-cyclic-AMP phosphodiesterase
MPLHLPALSRRRFLTSAAVTAAGLVLFRSGAGATEAENDPDYFIFLADTHIDQNSNRLLRGINPAEHLDVAVRRIVALRPRPAAVIINGDAANVRGLIGEYGLLAWLLRPLAEAGIPVHITLGNHDDREPFYTVMRKMRPKEPLVADRHLAVVETPSVYLFLLDTLDQVNNTPGLLGEAQLAWLERALDQYTDKPVILVGHHYPDTGNNRGLLDSDQLFRLADPRRHVKAYLFGHSHHWSIRQQEGLHLVNQPAMAHVFRESQTSAYLHVRFSSRNIRLEMDCIDRQHPWQGEKHTLAFRA